MRGLQERFYKKGLVTGLAICMLFTMTGCGAKSFAGGATESMAVYDAQSAAMSSNGSYKEVAEEALLDSGSFISSTTEAGTVEQPAAGENAAEMVAERKLIKTVDMNVETQEFDSLMSTIETQVKTLGGYIENMNTYNGSSYYNRGGTRNADMTIRIPKNKLDAFLNTVTGISNVIRRSDNVEDVTLAYVDLESHRDALRTEQTRLLELLEKAESIEDIITIEQRLSDVRYQLESMESQLRTYDNQVDYSTVYLSIEAVEVFTPVEEKTAWERISFGFVDSLHSIGEGFVEFGIWFVINIPYMVVWAVIVIAVVLIVCGIVKHYNKKSARNKAKVSANIAPAQNQQANDSSERK